MPRVWLAEEFNMSQPVLKVESAWSEPTNVVNTREAILSAMKAATDEGPGDYLRQLREVSKLELIEAATQLGLNKDQVVALENNDYENLPAPIYLKGFYRRYSSLLSIPADPVLNSYEQNTTDSNPELNRVTLKPGNRPVSFKYIGYAIVGSILFGVLYMLQGIDFSSLWGMVESSDVDQSINTATELALPQVEEVPLEEVVEP